MGKTIQHKLDKGDLFLLHLKCHLNSPSQTGIRRHHIDSDPALFPSSSVTCKRRLVVELRLKDIKGD